jgi:hypothetical protein
MALGDKCVEVSKLAANDPKLFIDMVNDGRLLLVSGKSFTVHELTQIVVTVFSDRQRAGQRWQRGQQF